MASELRHAAIVAGGLGSRARVMTGDTIPKALLPVAGAPILFRQLAVLAREGITHVTMLAGHLGGQLAPALAAEAERLSLTVAVLVEKEPLGTAGCLTALNVSEDTLIVYGDMLFDMDLERLAGAHAAGGAELTIVAHPNDHPETSDLVVERGGLARAILPKDAPRPADQRNLVPAGLYVAAAAFFRELTPGMKADMIHDVLPSRIAAAARIGVYNTPDYLRDVGSPARHALAEADIRGGRVMSLRQSRPAIFFDIDGVLNEEPGGHGVLSPDDVRLLPGASAALNAARAAGFLAVGVTNRPQLAKGLVDEDGLSRIFGRLESLLARDKAWLDRIYYCPHHPEAGHAGEVAALKITCDCRKPAPGLLKAAARDLNIDLRRSVMIGDSPRDIGAARAMGIRIYGVTTGLGFADGQPDALFDGVLEAVTAAVATP